MQFCFNKHANNRYCIIYGKASPNLTKNVPNSAATDTIPRVMGTVLRSFVSESDINA